MMKEQLHRSSKASAIVRAIFILSILVIATSLLIDGKPKRNDALLEVQDAQENGLTTGLTSPKNDCSGVPIDEERLEAKMEECKAQPGRMHVGPHCRDREWNYGFRMEFITHPG